jgi:ribokinase
VEWVHFARSTGPVVSGTILHLEGESWDEPGGGGGVAARALPALGARPARFYTALGDDEAAADTARILEADGVELRAARRSGPQNRVLGVIDPGNERTLFVLGRNEHPTIADDLPWDELATFDAAFFTGEDPQTLVAARRARVLVVTARRLPALIASGVEADVLIGSASDPGEQFSDDDLPVRPRAIVRTEGEAGGSYRLADGGEGRYAPVALSGPPVDAYGAGDVMMAALALALGTGAALERALASAATAAAGQLTRRGAAPPVRPGGA